MVTLNFTFENFIFSCMLHDLEFQLASGISM